MFSLNIKDLMLLTIIPLSSKLLRCAQDTPNTFSVRMNESFILEVAIEKTLKTAWL
ncbi:MAG: hypothetical protein LBF01_03420 [Bacteroidales bacterium]|nr:hypothetical protein [Bacteroidales bacterium]